MFMLHVLLPSLSLPLTLIGTKPHYVGMPATRAFPLLQHAARRTPLMAEVQREVLPRVAELLRHRGRWATSTLVDEAGLHCLFNVGSVHVPLTVLGATTSESPPLLLLHSPGLAGAFALPLEELRRCRGTFLPASIPASSATDCELGQLCLHEVLRGADAPTHNIMVMKMEQLYGLCRRRHFAATGMAALLARGAEVRRASLDLSFPYHVGGAQAEQHFHDVRHDLCSHLGNAHTQHGAKVLSRYGVAVCVGVTAAAKDGDGGEPSRSGSAAMLDVPTMMWHPTGAPAACLAPLLHGSPILRLGTTTLDYNGPTSASELLHVESPRRYMHLVDVGGRARDESSWLCEGLFGHRPGEVWGAPVPSMEEASFVVAGVAPTADDELDLLVRNTDTDWWPSLLTLHQTYQQHTRRRTSPLPHPPLQMYAISTSSSSPVHVDLLNDFLTSVGMPQPQIQAHMQCERHPVVVVEEPSSSSDDDALADRPQRSESEENPAHQRHLSSEVPLSSMRRATARRSTTAMTHFVSGSVVGSLTRRFVTSTAIYVGLGLSFVHALTMLGYAKVDWVRMRRDAASIYAAVSVDEPIDHTSSQFSRVVGFTKSVLGSMKVSRAFWAGFLGGAALL